MPSSAFFHLRTRVHFFSFSNTKISLEFFSSVSCKARTSVSTASYVKHLIATYNFSESEATSISKRLGCVKDAEKPVEVIEFLRKCDFSETQIRKCVTNSPQILRLQVETTLKPKLKILQDLGITGSTLGNLVSKNSSLLTISLENKLIPCVENLKKFLVDNRDVARVVCKCRGIFSKDPNLGFLPNLKLLENFGITGKHLSSLLKSQPYLFVMPGSALEDVVNRVREMGLSPDSKSFPYALDAMVGMKKETLSRKLEMLRSCGFSEQEAIMSFRKAPRIFKKSEEGLRAGIHFFLKTAKVNASVLAGNPSVLTLSVEKRLLPRYKVFSALKSKSLCNKNISLGYLLKLPEEKFLKNFILPFADQAEELLSIYRGNVNFSAT